MIRWARTLAVWAALGALGAGLLAVGAPYLIGGRSYTVMSGSMEPVIRTGDVVGERRLAATDIRPGDVVTFQDPERAGRLITHRVRSAEPRGGFVDVVTKGDANTGTEHWSVPASGYVGRVAYRVPHAGYALVLARGPWGRIGLIVIPALLLGIIELQRIWRRAPEEAAS